MEKVKLTGLWKNTDKNGQAYYAGNLSPTVRVMVFKNNFKQGERDPDLVVYLVPSEKKSAATEAKPSERPEDEDAPF